MAFFFLACCIYLVAKVGRLCDEATLWLMNNRIAAASDRVNGRRQA